VDNCSPVVNGRAVSAIVPVHIAVIHVGVWQKGPVASRQVDVDVDVDAGAHWSPSVVAATTSPGDPGRCPFIAGNPGPSVVFVVIPAAVVERSPSPGVVRYPGVSVVGHHPVAVGGIGMKIASHVGDPDPAIGAVVDPSAVRLKLIVKEIERDSPLGIIILVVVSLTIIVVSSLSV
jgi:hypothetical protein